MVMFRLVLDVTFTNNEADLGGANSLPLGLGLGLG